MSDGKDSPGNRMYNLKEYVQSQLDIASFYSKYITGDSRPLQRSNSEGWSERCLCPIHGDTGTPNFFVNVKTGHFKCHACGNSGSVFDFYMLTHGMTKDTKNLPTAIAGIATECGINVEQYKGARNIDGHLPARATEHAHEIASKRKNRVEEANVKANEIPKAHYEHFAQYLEPKHYKYLCEVRGLTKRTIEKRCIGVDTEAKVKDKETGQWTAGRLTIPVIASNGKCYNIRQYSHRAGHEFKILNYVIDKNLPTEKRYGSPPRLYCENEITEIVENVVICEGEFDCILLNQHFEDENITTWRAVTGTAGANTFYWEWVERLKGKNVFLCLDCDPPGINAAQEICTKELLPAANRGEIRDLRIVRLPLEGTKDRKDITDYFTKESGTVKEFIDLCSNSPLIVKFDVPDSDASVEAISVKSFDTVLRERRFIDKRVTVPITIVSAVDKIYHAIREYKVSGCPLMADAQCCSESCGDRIIPYGHSLFIESCTEREDRIYNRLRSIACQKDQKCSIVATKKVVMEEYFAHAVVERGNIGINKDSEESVHQKSSADVTHVAIYYLQPENKQYIDPKDYMATGWIRSHPKTMAATFFVEKLEQIEDDWRSFTMTDPDTKDKIYRVKNDFTTEDIINEITNGVTRILHSDEILYAVLLTFMSPLYIDFNGSRIRGWIITIIVGDSGVGKSTTYVRFSDWVGVGYFFSALSGTRTGLIYSTKQRNGEWYTAAGDYVRASGSIIAVDEIQVLERDTTRSLGNAIDRGFLEVKKVASGGFRTQTRGLFIGNPVDENGGQATLSSFKNGAESLSNFLDPMFVRRTDLAIFRSRREEFDYNAYLTDTERSAIKLTPEMMRSLIYWAWTREPRHIIWNEESTKACLEQATKLSRIFGDADKVPLVSPNDFRENLARLATAYAILDRSFTEDLEHVTVRPDHVQTVAGLVDLLYSSPDCNLREMSKAAGKVNRLIDPVAIEKFIERMMNEDSASTNTYISATYPTVRLILTLQTVGSVSIQDAPSTLGVQQEWVRKRCLQLQSIDMVSPGMKNTFATTRKFNLFMTKWRENPSIDEMLDNVNRKTAEYLSRGGQDLGRQQANSRYERSGPEVTESEYPF